MKTQSRETPIEDQVSESGGKSGARPERQWESFPQPADCSVKWDFEGLSQPPRVRDQSEVTATASGDPR